MLLRDRILEDPSDADALSKLAEMSIDEDRIDEATVLLQRASAADPTPARRLAVLRHLHKYASPALVLQEIEQFPLELRSSFHVRVAAEAVGAEAEAVEAEPKPRS